MGRVATASHRGASVCRNHPNAAADPGHPERPRRSNPVLSAFCQPGCVAFLSPGTSELLCGERYGTNGQNEPSAWLSLWPRPPCGQRVLFHNKEDRALSHIPSLARKERKKENI